MTIGRAITLIKILDLHHIDSTDPSGFNPDPEIGLPPIEDDANLEEMRRSFWVLFIFDTYASIRTRRPSQLGRMQVWLVTQS